jgi:uncharacterized protein YcbX
VLELHRWPVKSLRGERIAAVRLDERGFAGDRTYALWELREDGTTLRRLTARQAPRMLLWTAAYRSLPDDALDPNTPPPAVVTAPDGRKFRTDEAALALALSEDLGRRVEVRRDVLGQQDRGQTALVTLEASRQALERRHGREIGIVRFRPNIHVELGLEAFAEERLEGARLAVGEAEFELLNPCARCVIPTRDPDTAEKWPQLMRALVRERAGLFGINARPLAPARVIEGDEVVITYHSTDRRRARA